MIMVMMLVTIFKIITTLATFKRMLVEIMIISYQVTFSAIITTLITLLLPTNIAEPLIRTLIGIFGISDLGPFILDSYLPKVVTHIHISGKLYDMI